MKYLFLQSHTHTENNKGTSTKGFTLIEIMVSVAIFAIIITSGMGALVSMTHSYQTSQAEKKVHDGLNYALEAMTREIRLGQSYEPNVNITQEIPPIPTDGISPSNIKFTTTDNRGTVIYYLSGGVLYLKRFGATNAQNGDEFALTNNSQLIVDDVRFTVVGTDPREDENYQQPLVWIQIRAHATGSERITVVQTMVSQRALDI